MQYASIASHGTKAEKTNLQYRVCNCFVANIVFFRQKRAHLLKPPKMMVNDSTMSCSTTAQRTRFTQFVETSALVQVGGKN